MSIFALAWVYGVSMLVLFASTIAGKGEAWSARLFQMLIGVTGLVAAGHLSGFY